MVDLIFDEFLKYSCCFCSSFHSYETRNKLTWTNCTLKSLKIITVSIWVQLFSFLDKRLPFVFKIVTTFIEVLICAGCWGVLVQNHPLYLQYKERKLLTTSEELVTSRAGEPASTGVGRRWEIWSRAPRFNNSRAPATPDWLDRQFHPLKVAIWMTFIGPGKKKLFLPLQPQLFDLSLDGEVLGKLNISLTLLTPVLKIWLL